MGDDQRRRATSAGRRWGRRLLVGAAVSVVLVLGAAAAAGQVLISPTTHPVGPPPRDLPARAVDVPVPGRGTVRGWLVPGRPDAPGVLLLHGLRSDRRAMLPRARWLHAQGYTTLLVDLQSHGESDGEHPTFGRLESQDVTAAVGFLRRQVRGRPVGVVGVSLGGAATVLADPPLDVQAVVLESVYADFGTAVDNRLRLHLGPAGPLLSGLLVLQLLLRLGISADDLRPVDRIGGLRAPVLVCSGDADRHATLAEAQALYAAAPEPKALWVVPGAAHVDLYDADPAAYRARVGDFLAQRLGPVLPPGA
ncbi:alpha/beta hydrolase [Kineosporia sp. A_224]|uniref:alpha/beta hydrolase n=1 Tax=Kineosporia sp. A_224 TaxID=1962180 RepID=UPI000B4ADC10|nr:alpha/beta hydrolase [Kineosporia sp. A_224]